MKGWQRFLYLVFLFFTVGLCAQDVPWTWLYVKQFSSKELEQQQTKKQQTFAKQGVKPFSQLMLSWNAVRPEKGYFIFASQVRDAETKKWYPWHEMVHWGADVQKSLESKHSSGTGYHYVRLEVPPHTRADAFRVRVKAVDQANLADVHALAVNTADFSQFGPEIIDADFFQKPSLKLSNVPRISQMALDHEDARSLCSPTSMTMLAGYLSDEFLCPLAFAQNVYDNGLHIYGSWPFNTAHAYELSGNNAYFYVTRLQSVHELYTYIAQRVPVVVSVRGQIEGAPLPYKKGHLLVVVGFDQEHKKVLCHDPAFDDDEQTVVAYDIKSFMQAWERSRRLAYVAELKKA